MEASAVRNGGNETDSVARLIAARDPLTKVSALRELGDAGARSAVEVILAARIDADVDERAAAVWALRSMEGSVVAQSLVAALSDEAARVRVAALDAIALQSIRAYVPALIAVLNNDPDASVREAAVRALACVVDGHPTVACALALAARRDRDANVRAAATAARRAGRR